MWSLTSKGRWETVVAILLSDVTFRVQSLCYLIICPISLSRIGQYLKIGLKGHPPILDGELYNEIQVDETTWCIEDQKILLLSFEKVRATSQTHDWVWTFVYRVWQMASEACLSIQFQHELSSWQFQINQMEWWSRIITSEPEINTKKVQPENSKVTE